MGKSKPTQVSPSLPSHDGGTLRNDLRPELNLIEVPLGEFRVSETNVRTAKKKQVENIKRSVGAFGFVRPILIDSNKVIIDGVAQFQAARELGLQALTCIQVEHLNDTEIRALRIALIRMQETGSWDELGLKLEFEHLIEFDFDLTITGFEPTEIDQILEIGSEAGEAGDPLDEFGDLPAPDAPAATSLGDLWILGEHRVLCGNARDRSAIQALTGGNSVAMVFADPPYNVQVNGQVRVTVGQFEEFAEASGELTPDEFVAFLTEALGNAVAGIKPGSVVYVCMDWRHIVELSEALERSGLKPLNICVWVKPNGGMGSLYRSRHEMVFVAKRPGAPHRNNVELGKHGRYRTNVWEYAGATGGRADEDGDFALHPTVKPVRMVRDTILDVSAIGEVVPDPFLGSGTTLLAAERCHRICYGLVISPAYVDVAIRRWQDMTGLKAIHAETGETYAERAAAILDDQGHAGEPSPASDDLVSGASVATGEEGF